jgi:hypothetical protein
LNAVPYDPDDVLELFLGFWISRTVIAAVDLGVFEALEGRALDDAPVARHPSGVTPAEGQTKNPTP